MKNTFVCNFPHRGLFGRTHTHSYISNAFPGPGKHRDILSAETLTEKCVGVTSGNTLSVGTCDDVAYRSCDSSQYQHMERCILIFMGMRGWYIVRRKRLWQIRKVCFVLFHSELPYVCQSFYFYSKTEINLASRYP